MDNETKNVVFLDVRNTWEYKEKYLENSISIPFNKLPDELERVLGNKDIALVVFCSTGTRSKIAKEYISSMGYNNIIAAGTIDEIKSLYESSAPFI